MIGPLPYQATCIPRPLLHLDYSHTQAASNLQANSTVRPLPRCISNGVYLTVGWHRQLQGSHTITGITRRTCLCHPQCSSPHPSHCILVLCHCLGLVFSADESADSVESI